MINTTSERLKAINFFICWYFSFDEHLKFHAQLSWAGKKFYNLGARVVLVLLICELRALFLFFIIICNFDLHTN